MALGARVTTARWTWPAGENRKGDTGTATAEEDREEPTAPAALQSQGAGVGNGEPGGRSGRRHAQIGLGAVWAGGRGTEPGGGRGGAVRRGRGTGFPGPRAARF